MTMVERVAKAICLASMEDDLREVVDIDSYPLADSYYDLARAAILAMREPDEAQLAAVKPEPAHLYESRGEDYRRQMRAAVVADREGARSDWQRMIDAALDQDKSDG